MIENIKEDACFRLGEKYMFRVLSIDERTESSVNVSCMFLDIVRNTLSTRKIILKDTTKFYSVEQKDFLDYMMRSHKLSQIDSGRHEEIIVPKRSRKFSRAVSVLSLIIIILSALPLQAQDTVHRLKEVSIVSSYRVSSEQGSLIDTKKLESENTGQEPCFVLSQLPSVFSYGDNGSEFGYAYMRVRGMDQTRINVTLDGMPWNEAEDFGCYFANQPDLMSSLHSLKLERGSSVSGNGTAAYAGNISLESVNLKTDTTSYLYLGYGSFNSHKTGLVYNMGVKNNWGLHLKLTSSGTDGYKYYSSNKSESATMKLGYFFNENHSIDFLTMNGWHKNGQGYEGVTLEELTLDPRTNGNSPYDDDNWVMSIDKIQYRGIFGSRFMLVGSLYYMYQDGGYRFDLDNYMWRMIDPTWLASGMVYNYGLTQHMLGANLIGKLFLGKTEIDFGTNAYQFQRRHYLDTTEFCRNLTSLDFYDNLGKKRDFNAFGKVKYENSGFKAFGNLQYRYVDFSYTDVLNSTLSFNPGDSTVWNFLNYEIGVEYVISNQKIYARFSKTGREPMRSDMFGGNEWFSGSLATTTPEIAHDLEIGADIKTKKFSGNINFYYMYFENELVLNGLFGTNGLPAHENAESSYRFGMEFSGAYKLGKHVSLINNSSLSRNIVKTEAYGTKYHTFTPAITINQDVEYSISQYKFGLGLRYRSELYVDMWNDYKLPSALTLNAYIKAEYESWDLSLRVGNITNERTYSSAVIGASELLYLIDVPFNVMASVKYKF
jgi:iron complex outermembrane receptor protein